MQKCEKLKNRTFLRYGFFYALWKTAIFLGIVIGVWRGYLMVIMILQFELARAQAVQRS